MNSNTKERLKHFIDAIDVLAQRLVNELGTEDTEVVRATGQVLKDALDNDETIL